ncbi:MAG TPA: tetratricopeptide repeat protein [Terriglobales bacterium]|nr:tetratricopeptide repeat protein [Terriglobales bacterium]
MWIKRVQGRRAAIIVITCALASLFLGAASAQETAADSTESDATRTHLGRGYDALKQDRYDEAAQEFRAALAADPSLVLRARFPLAVALFESHKADEARREFETVRGEVGDHPNVLYYLGRMDLDSLDYASAVRNLTKAAVKPPFPDTSYYLGLAYFKRGDLRNAEKWLKDAQSANPNDARVPYQLGFVYRKQGLEEKAKKSMALSQRLRQRDTDESRIKTECGEKLEKGSREEAHAVCDQLYDANNADKLTSLGTLYGQHGDLDAALKPLKRAAELAPQSPQMQYNLALTYFQLSQFENARKPLEPAIKRWPDLFQINFLYGAVLMKIGEFQPAYEALRHAHDLNPQDSATTEMLYATTFDLAQQTQKAHQYSDALRYFAEASKMRPASPDPHRRMAEIYTLTGRPDQARTEQEIADKLTGKNGAS